MTTSDHWDTPTGSGSALLTLYMDVLSQDVAANTSTLRARLEISGVGGATSRGNPPVACYISGVEGGQIDSSFTWAAGTPSKTIIDVTRTITHNSDGTASLSVYGFIAATGTAGIGGPTGNGPHGFTLPVIPRATQPTVSPSSGSTGSNYTIGHSPASSSFYHDIAYSLDGGGAYTTIASSVPGTDTSTVWTPAHTLLPNSTSVTAIIRVITRDSPGGTVIGTKTVSLPLTVPSSVKPTISSVSWVETQTSAPDLPTLMGGAGRFVQRWSKLKPTVTSAGAGGSTIVGASVTQNGQTTPSGSAFGLPIALSGAVPYSAWVTDSRARDSDQYVNTVAVTAYNFPNLPTPLVTRTSDAAGNIPSSTGTYLAITPGASVSSLIFGGAQKNLLEWQVRTMPVGGSWTTKQAWTTSTVSGNTWTTKYVAGGGFAADTEYIVEVSIRDLFGKNGYNTSSTVAVVMVGVPSEHVAFDWDGSNGLGIGKYRTQGMLDVAGDIYADGEKVGGFHGNPDYAKYTPDAPFSIYPLGTHSTLVDPTAGWPVAGMYGNLLTVRAYSGGGGTIQYWSSYQAEETAVYYRQWFYQATAWSPWSSASTFPGVILAYGGSVAPPTYYLCDGSAKNTTTDAVLFEVIGYKFGGSGTSFNLPNLKGRTPVGLDAAQTEFNVLGEVGGAKTHTLTIAQMPSHTHTFLDADNNTLAVFSNSGGTGMDNKVYRQKTTDGTGGGGAHNNLQPYLVTNYIIKR